MKTKVMHAKIQTWKYDKKDYFKTDIFSLQLAFTV